MSHNARQTGPALEAMYRFTLWLIPTLEKFPRSQRFLPGDRIETTALDLLDLLIQATYTRERRGQLQQANLGLTKLRHLLRLAYDLKYLDPPAGRGIRPVRNLLTPALNHTRRAPRAPKHSLRGCKPRPA